MSRFLEDAMEIFETAKAAADGPSDMAILIDDTGAMRVVDATGWRPETLQAHYGARTVYQVTRALGAVRVTGRSLGQTCRLEAEPPAKAIGCQHPIYFGYTLPESRRLIAG